MGGFTLILYDNVTAMMEGVSDIDYLPESVLYNDDDVFPDIIPKTQSRDALLSSTMVPTHQLSTIKMEALAGTTVTYRQQLFGRSWSVGEPSRPFNDSFGMTSLSWSSEEDQSASSKEVKDRLRSKLVSERTISEKEKLGLDFITGDHELTYKEIRRKNEVRQRNIKYAIESRERFRSKVKALRETNESLDSENIHLLREISRLEEYKTHLRKIANELGLHDHSQKPSDGSDVEEHLLSSTSIRRSESEVGSLVDTKPIYNTGSDLKPVHGQLPVTPHDDEQPWSETDRSDLTDQTETDSEVSMHGDTKDKVLIKDVFLSDTVEKPVRAERKFTSVKSIEGICKPVLNTSESHSSCVTQTLEDRRKAGTSINHIIDENVVMVIETKPDGTIMKKNPSVHDEQRLLSDPDTIHQTEFKAPIKITDSSSQTAIKSEKTSLTNERHFKVFHSVSPSAGLKNETPSFSSMNVPHKRIRSNSGSAQISQTATKNGTSSRNMIVVGHHRSSSMKLPNPKTVLLTNPGSTNPETLYVTIPARSEVTPNKEISYNNQKPSISTTGSSMPLFGSENDRRGKGRSLLYDTYSSNQVPIPHSYKPENQRKTFEDSSTLIGRKPQDSGDSFTNSPGTESNTTSKKHIRKSSFGSLGDVCADDSEKATSSERVANSTESLTDEENSILSAFMTSDLEISSDLESFDFVNDVDTSEIEIDVEKCTPLEDIEKDKLVPRLPDGQLAVLENSISKDVFSSLKNIPTLPEDLTTETLDSLLHNFVDSEHEQKMVDQLSTNYSLLDMLSNTDENPVPQLSSSAENPVPQLSSSAENPVSQLSSTTKNSMPQQPSTAENYMPQQPSTAENSMPQQPSTAENSMPQQPSTAENSMPQQPSTAENSMPQQPSTAENSMPQQPSTAGNSMPQRPSTAEISMPQQPYTAENPMPQQPSTAENSMPQQPKTTENSMPQQPKTTENSMPQQPKTTENSMPQQPKTTENSMPQQPKPTENSMPQLSKTTENSMPQNHVPRLSRLAYSIVQMIRKYPESKNIDSREITEPPPSFSNQIVNLSSSVPDHSPFLRLMYVGNIAPIYGDKIGRYL